MYVIVLIIFVHETLIFGDIIEPICSFRVMDVTL